jgi:quercetin dioxygenase-like cupin family protein
MAEKNPEPYVLLPGEGDAMWGGDGALTLFKATGERTGERFAMIEDQAARGEGTSLHRHTADDESFYVLEGELAIAIGDDPPVARRPGALSTSPVGWRTRSGWCRRRRGT